jgi:hypothetical protein
MQFFLPEGSSLEIGRYHSLYCIFKRFRQHLPPSAYPRLEIIGTGSPKRHQDRHILFSVLVPCIERISTTFPVSPHLQAPDDTDRTCWPGSAPGAMHHISVTEETTERRGKRLRPNNKDSASKGSHLASRSRSSPRPNEWIQS